jgi:Flp pilus assembly protein TadG
MRRKFGKQRGVAMVEMVIVTPLLLILLIGVAEMGKALIQYNTLNKSLRDAARLVAGSALLGTTGTVLIDPALAADARNLAVYGNILGTGSPNLPLLSANQITVTSAANNMVVVEANYPYVPIVGPVFQTFGTGNEFSLSWTMTAVVTMRAL